MEGGKAEIAHTHAQRVHEALSAMDALIRSPGYRFPRLTERENNVIHRIQDKQEQGVPLTEVEIREMGELYRKAAGEDHIRVPTIFDGG